MKTLIIHDTETEARRARRPAPGETITYVAKADWKGDPDDFGTVQDLSTLKKKQKKNDL